MAHGLHEEADKGLGHHLVQGAGLRAWATWGREGQGVRAAPEASQSVTRVTASSPHGRLKRPSKRLPKVIQPFLSPKIV